MSSPASNTRTYLIVGGAIFLIALVYYLYEGYRATATTKIADKAPVQAVIVSQSNPVSSPNKSVETAKKIVAQGDSNTSNLIR